MKHCGVTLTIEELVNMEMAVPVLPVTDLAVAKAFYIEKLGFDLAFEVSDDGKTGLLGIRRGTIEMTLDCPMAGHGRDACVTLRVDNVDRYYDEWRSKAAMNRPPKNEPWCVRTFDVIDPFGNTIFVMGPVT